MTTYAIRCGCGRETKVKTLTKMIACPKCGWPLIYSSSEKVTCLSHHASLTIARGSPT